MAVAGLSNLRFGRRVPILFVPMSADANLNVTSNAAKARSKAAR
jgi:hypothetical protein